MSARSIFGIFIFQLQFRASAFAHTHIERGSLGRKTKVREVSSSVKLQSEFFSKVLKKRQSAQKKGGRSYIEGLRGLLRRKSFFKLFGPGSRPDV